MSQHVYQLVTDRILALLEQGVVPWKKPWKTTGGSAPRNFVSRKVYRGVNLFLLVAQRFGSPYWLTFRQAQERGGHVCRGERGTPIVFWRIDERTVEDAEAEEGTAEYRRIILRYYTVFNLEQCEGIETAGTGTVEDGPFDPIPACEAVFANMPNPPTLRHGGERACYNRVDDLVRMPRPEAFRRREHYYSTLYHELGHHAAARIIPRGTPERNVRSRKGLYGERHNHSPSRGEVLRSRGPARLPPRRR
jgi:antirestriction protein ArdC